MKQVIKKPTEEENRQGKLPNTWYRQYSTMKYKLELINITILQKQLTEYKVNDDYLGGKFKIGNNSVYLKFSLHKIRFK